MRLCRVGGNGWVQAVSSRQRFLARERVGGGSKDRRLPGISFDRVAAPSRHEERKAFGFLACSTCHRSQQQRGRRR